MFSNVLQQATGLLERRFVLNAFFPNLIFWGLLIMVGIARGSRITNHQSPITNIHCSLPQPAHHF